VISRTRGPMPAIFRSPQLLRERQRMAAFYLLPTVEREQQKFKRRYNWDSSIWEALINCFGQCCMYCEQPLGPRWQIDNFRPERNAMDLDGEISLDHYWWLALEWENLYLCCQECNAIKRNLFPVAGQRAPLETIGERLTDENRLLLDPCRDDPEQHLTITPNGIMYGRTHQGEVTIQVLGLNRDSLVQSRRKAFHEATSLWRQYVRLITRDRRVDPPNLVVDLENRLLSWFSGTSQDTYLLPRRQLVRLQLAENPKLAEKLPDDWKHITNARISQGTVPETRETKPASDSTFSLTRRRQLENYYVLNQQLRRVEIRNFKAISYLDLTIPEHSDNQVPCLMLLGENSTGKTSVLRAIALALMGQRQRNQLQLDARDYLRHGTKSGYVKLHLSGHPKPLEVHFDRKDLRFIGGVEETPLLLMGFGATRLLPPKQRSEVQSPVGSTHCENLFDPHFPMVDADTWLSKLDHQRFTDAAVAIKQLLVLDDQITLTQGLRGGHTVILAGKSTLAQLSDGYQTTIALACDILRVLQDLWQSSEVAQGIVLLDEVESHLHPRWKMRIVHALRGVFPGVQFIMTSHDPLCLRGMKEGEVVVMSRDRKRAIQGYNNLPTPDALRVDQLLTSPYFGLHSTIDPDLEAMFEQYYSLLSLNERTNEQQTALEKFASELERYNALGETRRERLMYKAIDTFLAREEKRESAEAGGELSDELLRLLAEIWNDSEDPA
jgi:5-methylcytosine-specific restriction endonuclease McrA